MIIQAVSYASYSKNTLKVITDDGTIFLPWPCFSWHGKNVQTWLDSGHEIGGFIDDPKKRLSREDLAVLVVALVENLIANNLVDPMDLPSDAYQIYQEYKEAINRVRTGKL